MSIKRNKEVKIKLAISQEEFDEIVELICESISGSIDDIDRKKTYNVSNIEINRYINRSDSALWGLSIYVQIDNEYAELEASIIQRFVQLHIDSYNQSIKQEKEIRKDRRNGY